MEDKEWTILEQLLDDEGYHGFRIAKRSDGFEPQHNDEHGWRSYECVAKTPEEAMEYLMEQPLEL